MKNNQYTELIQAKVEKKTLEALRQESNKNSTTIAQLIRYILNKYFKLK